jgi:hypothetical protein
MSIPRTRENLKAVKNNAKIVIATGTELVNIIGEMAGIIPLGRNQKEDLLVESYYFFNPFIVEFSIIN